MTGQFFLSLAAVVSLLPAGLLVLKRQGQGEASGLFRGLLVVGVVGPFLVVSAQATGNWQTGLSSTLWVTVAAAMSLFFIISLITRGVWAQSWRLAPLVSGYMAALGLLAMIWQQAPGQVLGAMAPAGWVQVHIFVSVMTYALATLAALAALGAILQERALKARRPTALTHTLPSVADCDGLQVRLLGLAEIILGLGLLTGMATQYMETGAILVFEHKMVLSIATFALIGGLLFVHHRTGMRGRKAARVALTAYLLLTLGYPGVKFVTDVVMG